ncbi:hypothetical protein ACLOJK_038357 [Asimina triloba]
MHLFGSVGYCLGALSAFDVLAGGRKLPSLEKHSAMWVLDKTWPEQMQRVDLGHDDNRGIRGGFYFKGIFEGIS